MQIREKSIECARCPIEAERRQGNAQFFAENCNNSCELHRWNELKQGSLWKRFDQLLSWRAVGLDEVVQRIIGKMAHVRILAWVAYVEAHQDAVAQARARAEEDERRRVEEVTQ